MSPPPLSLEPHRRAVFAVCYGITGSAADAEDLVQETFVRALERPPADASRPLAPWLTTVGANLARDALRRRRLAGYTGPYLPAPIDESLWPGGDATAEDRYARIERLGFAYLVALEALSPTQRAVVVLRDVAELSVRETAEALGTSEANVKTIHLRARKALAPHEAREADRAPPDVAFGAIQRLLGGLAAADLDAVLGVLAPDVTTTNDGGGEYQAALRVVRGADHVARFHLGLQRRMAATGTASFSLRSIGGAPALVLTLPGAPARVAPRVVLAFDVDAAGRIRAIHTVLASRKLTHVRFDAAPDGRDDTRSS